MSPNKINTTPPAKTQETNHMVNPKIITLIRRYQAAFPAAGIHPTAAILFGSYTRGNTHEWSDIDLIVIAPEFDQFRPIPLDLVTRLWTTAASTDLRLEPIPCGAEEWARPHSRPILSAAENGGLEIAA